MRNRKGTNEELNEGKFQRSREEKDKNVEKKNKRYDLQKKMTEGFPW